MSVSNYDELRQHIGHRIVCASYGDNGEDDGVPENVAIECETCGEVLLDFDWPGPGTWKIYATPRKAGNGMTTLGHGVFKMQLHRKPDTDEEGLTMEVKTLEIRDEGTFIAALAINMHSERDTERRLLRRCGYALDGHPNVLLTRLDGSGMATNDPYAWGGRTWPVAHDYIIRRWDELKSGAVVDVEFILGETTAPKPSEVQDDA